MAGIVQFVAKFSPKQSEIVNDLRRRQTCIGMIDRMRHGGQAPDFTEVAPSFENDLKHPLEGVS